jgi:hypothetical protein
MASTVGFVPGTIIRWRKRCFVVVDRDGMDTIIVQEHGKGGFERIPVREAQPGHGPRTGTTQRPDLISVPEEEWQAVVRQFKPLLKLSRTQRTLTRVQKAADALGSPVKRFQVNRPGKLHRNEAALLFQRTAEPAVGAFYLRAKTMF